MNDAFTVVDAVLWSVAVALLVLAIWIQAQGERPWDPAVWFAAVLAAFSGGKVPLREGPVPAEGWEGDPEELGEDYEPERRLGPGLDWPAVRGWTPAVTDTIRRRLADVRLVWLGAPGITVPEIETRQFDSGEGAGERIAKDCDRPELRLVFASHEGDALLRLLHASPGLRDRARAVLLVGSPLDPAWLASSFDHVAFDVELARQVPYMTLRTEGSSPLPDPPDPPSARRSVLPIDLGIAEPAEIADVRFGRALAALFASLG